MENDIIEKIQQSIKTIEDELHEIKMMISDISACESAISKKYLIAALKKQYLNVQTAVNTVSSAE